MSKIFVFLTLGFSTSAFAHSGGTDSYGCHTNHKTGDYHCHNPKLQEKVKVEEKTKVKNLGQKTPATETKK